jgi:NAD(P)-dependent dehydrogenase (short-subunit alcohol dehydrogenase family)
MVCDVDDDAGAETVALVEAEGAAAEYRHCDVSEPEQIRALMDAAVKRFGGIDVLHNNAGVQESYYTTDLAVDTLPEEVWDKVYAINLRSVWLATKYAAPHLRASTRDPNIVNAGSSGGLTGYQQCPVYSAMKAGVIMLTKSTALDLAPAVRCNCYSPGSVKTNMIERFREAAEDLEALDRVMLGTHLIPRYGEPVEVARLVCFLASEEAAWMTGSNYVIDGGLLAWRGTRPVDVGATASV